MTLPPARAAYKIPGKSNIRVSVLIEAAGHTRAKRIGWGGLRKEPRKWRGVHGPVEVERRKILWVEGEGMGIGFRDGDGGGGGGNRKEKTYVDRGLNA